MLAAQGGANILYGAGMIEMGMTFDLAQLMIDSEIFKMVLHTIRGFEVNEETLALDVIKRVKFGEFLSQKHTSDTFAKYQSNTLLSNRQSRKSWLEAGGKDMTQVAVEKAIEILESHTPDPLTDDQAAYVRRIIEDAEKEYGLTE